MPRCRCCRRGGATQHYRMFASLDATGVRGRWSNSRTCRLFINDAIAALNANFAPLTAGNVICLCTVDPAFGHWSVRSRAPGSAVAVRPVHWWCAHRVLRPALCSTCRGQEPGKEGGGAACGGARTRRCPHASMVKHAQGGATTLACQRPRLLARCWRSSPCTRPPSRCMRGSLMHARVLRWCLRLSPTLARLGCLS